MEGSDGRESVRVRLDSPLFLRAAHVDNEICFSVLNVQHTFVPVRLFRSFLLIAF